MNDLLMKLHQASRYLFVPSKFKYWKLKFQVPLQFLAAEYELGWKGVEQGQPILDHAATLFTNAPRVDARILLGGGHDFEFSKNEAVLQEARDEFVNSLVGGF